MVKSHMPEYRISVEQLRPGVFIRLERTSWFDHPFLFSKFKIRDEEQIALLRELGITSVICNPSRSDALPLRPADRKSAPAKPEKQLKQEVIDHLWEIKKERTRRLREKKERIARCEEKFTSCIRDFDNILKGVLGGNSGAVEESMAFVERLSANFLDDRESTLHLMNVVDQEEAAYSHSMNVALLSMMVGKEAMLDREEMLSLGLGALLHDIGKEHIPKKLLKKKGQLTKPEQDILDRHAAEGAALIAKVAEFPETVALIVAQHHERADGSGYPLGIAGKEIERLAAVVAIADAYDNHTNSTDPNASLTPYLALSYMFGQQKQLFDVETLTLFIRCLGVYPPGTVVELSNGSIGMVMSVNPKNQLNPSVVLYDEEVPKKEALIVDLVEEPELRVEKSIRLGHLPQAVLDYLSPRTKITYFIDPNGG